MKFIIKDYKDIWSYFWQQRLLYLPDEHSFYMKTIVDKVDIELIVNKIGFTLSSGIIVCVSGFCGLSKSMLTSYQVPKYKRGILRVEHNLKHGFAYGINDNDTYEYPVYVNIQTGWVCIGNPEETENAVEFINNCVAVIDNNGEFVSLWLKPQSLPQYLLE